MDMNKRKFSYNQSLAERTKKLRNEIDQPITSIENIPNEFFYEIFDYLDGCDIWQAFSNLKYRFQKLLNSSSLLFKITFHSSKCEEKFTKNYKQIILFNKSQIFSIHFLSSVHYQFMLYLDIDWSFDRLESLSFDSIKPAISTSLLRKLTNLPRLFLLTIDTGETLQDLTDIYRLIFDLPKLKYIRFFATASTYTNVTVSLPFCINQQFSNIKHLVIDHPCTFNKLFSIISYTPQISRLSFMYKRDRSEILSRMILSNLTHLFIYGDNITLNEFEMFITKIDSKLKVLSLKDPSEDIAYVNADRWEQLILKYFPQLEKFYLTYCMFFESEDGTPKFVGESNSFNSQFWIERQWLLEAEVTFDHVMYSIHPYKKKWYEFDLQHNMINSSNELAKSMRTVFTIIPYIDEHCSLKYISTVAEIYHLEINEKLYTNTLMEVLRLLPDLDCVSVRDITS